jgi:predicted nucleic acid-binding protein
MPVEPGAVDANVLVYAFDTKAPQHAASRTLLDAARTGATMLYVTSQVLCEFYSIVTNARRVLKPRTSADALTAISDMPGFLRVLPVPVTAVDKLMALLRRRPVTGGEIFDLQAFAPYPNRPPSASLRGLTVKDEAFNHAGFQHCAPPGPCATNEAP